MFVITIMHCRCVTESLSDLRTPTAFIAKTVTITSGGI